VPHPSLRLVAILCCAALALTAAVAEGRGALVVVNTLILRADGGFQPRTLPRHSYKPIDFHGYASVASRVGGLPVALQQVVVDFDRDGRISTGGLPTCAPESVANLSTEEARAACRGAIVGKGELEALVAIGASTFPASSPLTLFNGPRLEGNPTVVAHTRVTVPAQQTFAILVPIERRPGGFRYRATLDLPPIAGGLGSVTKVKVEVGRHYEVGGQRRSYVAARCSDGVLETHGRFTFADGTIIDGSVEKACTALPRR